ncbi:hypothetical protein Tco_1441542 [Tanacetum coccineum]
MSIRRINILNTPYSETQETKGIDRVKNEHLYSASTNEIDEKKPELKYLPSHLEYAYLHAHRILPYSNHTKRSRKDDVHLSLWNFAYRRMRFGLCNAPKTFQRCMMAIFYDMVEDFMEVFMDDLSVFDNSFNCCLANLDKMLARCEETNHV